MTNNQKDHLVAIIRYVTLILVVLLVYVALFLLVTPESWLMRLLPMLGIQ